MPSLRTDTLFRCHNTLLSVEWRKGDAHVVALSEMDHGWNIKESIDDGVAGEHEGIRYGYFVDKGHTHPVRIDLEGDKHCTIDRSTASAVIGRTWKKSFYKVREVLDLIHSLPIVDN